MNNIFIKGLFLATISFNLAVAQIQNVIEPLDPNSIHLHGYFENDIQNSIQHWNKGVVPYSGFTQFFKTGRPFFALGETWGKAVRSGCMFYRYTQDPELKKILDATVADLLSSKRENGCISCSEVNKQPDGPNGDMWERKYVLLGLHEYYSNVNPDPAILAAMIQQADCILSQTGPSPKIRIVDQGWSPNHIESSTILEPIMRLHKMTGYPRYLEFAKYIVEVEGGAKDHKIIEDAYNNKEPEQIGGVYPKAYEMMSLFEGVMEYYRATGSEKWKLAVLNLYNNIRKKEITIIGNGGGDQPYHPEVLGEAWDNTALEQTNPNMKRMMETCVGVTWMKLCSQVLRLTGDPAAVDEIEKYIYNGLIGAMKPTGDGFSYVNLLNGVKTNPNGWGKVIDSVHVTCCNLNGPMGLAYIPYVAIMNSSEGPVINLYNAATAHAPMPSGNQVELKINTDFPYSNKVSIEVSPAISERFVLRLRIPAWSESTVVKVNGKKTFVTSRSYALLERTWAKGDKVDIEFEMKAKVINAPRGSNRAGDHFQAVVYGPIVLARDENLDVDYNKPVDLMSTKDGDIKIIAEKPIKSHYRMQFKVPTKGGVISMVDYASIDNWNETHVCTWLPKKTIK